MLSLKENLFESTKRKNVFRFWKDVCKAHKQGKLQGKDAVQKFVNDSFHNLMHVKTGRRYNTFTKSIYEMIKLWGIPILHSYISLNLDGPSISTTLRKVRQSLAYILGEYEHIFRTVGNFILIIKLGMV